MLCSFQKGKLHLQNVVGVSNGTFSALKIKVGKHLVSFPSHLKAFYLEMYYLVCRISIISTHMHQFYSVADCFPTFSYYSFFPVRLKQIHVAVYTKHPCA
jgi:hypothetical protein